MSRIKSTGAQAFNVPNDSEGNEFLRLLRKFRNKGWSYHARGRGPRKLPGENYVSFRRQSSIPKTDSKWMAVYLDNTKKGPAFPPFQMSLLTPWEKMVLKAILDDTVDGHTPDLNEEMLTALEEINGKLDL